MDGLGQAFYQEAKLPGSFHVEHWCQQWSLLIRAKIGFMWLLMQNEAVIGGIGVLVSPDINNGELVMQEAFWYVAKEHRRGLGGMRLLREIERFAKEAGICRVIMGRIHATDPDNKVKNMLERMGYVATETNHCKTIFQDV